MSRRSSEPSERTAVSRLAGKGYTPGPVRRLLRPEILVLAAGALALAGAAWRVSSEPAPTVSQRDRDGAIAAVRSFVSLSTHLRSSGGDERFADRIPADRAVVSELVTDVDLGRRGGREEEESRLVRVDVRDVRPSLAFLVEVRTKEYWVTRSRPGGADVRSDVLLVRYVVRRDGGAWKIADWDLELGADAQEGGP